MTLDFLRFSHYYCFFPPSLHEHRAEVVFAVVDGREVGFALYFNNFSTFIGHSGLYLEDLFVWPDDRGKGYGKALLLHLVKIAREHHAEEWNGHA